MYPKTANGPTGLFLISPAHTRNVKVHVHRNIELAYVQSGRMIHEIDGQKSVFEAGDYYIIDAGMSHGYRALSEKLLIRNFIFTADFLDSRLMGTTHLADVLSTCFLCSRREAQRIRLDGILLRDEDRSILHRLDLIEEEFDKGEFGNLDMIRFLLTEILLQTARKVARTAQPAPLNQAVAQTVEYVREHFREKVKLADLARETGYSVPYLSELFSREMGAGFSRFVEQVRLDHACHLLATTDWKIARIAEQIGYGDVRFFNQIFKKKMSITPREFRKVLQTGS